MHHFVLTFTAKFAMTTTTSFFLPLFVTLLLQCCLGTASGDSAKTLSPQNFLLPKVVRNVVTPKEINFFQKKSPPFSFNYFYRFPLTAYRHRHYLHPSPQPFVPMQPTPETPAALSPPSNLPPADPNLPQPQPPTVPRWSRQWPFLAPPALPIESTGKQGTPPSVAPPSPLISGVPSDTRRTPHWPRPRLFPRWRNPRPATLPVHPPKISNWLHPRWPRVFVKNPYHLHPRLFKSLSAPGSPDAYPFRLPVRSHWPTHISNRPPIQTKLPVQFKSRPIPGSFDEYPYRLPVRSHWPAHISNRPPMQTKPPVQFKRWPVPGSSDEYPFRLPVRSHWPNHISNHLPMQIKPPIQHP